MITEYFCGAFHNSTPSDDYDVKISESLRLPNCNCEHNSPLCDFVIYDS